MPEQVLNITDFLNKISAVKGEEYTKGLVDGVNLATPDPETEKEDKNKNVPAI